MLDDRRIRIRIGIRTSDSRIRIQEAQKHTDTQHCKWLVLKESECMYSFGPSLKSCGLETMRSSPGLKTSGYFDHGSVFTRDILQLVLKPHDFAKRLFSKESDFLGPARNNALRNFRWVITIPQYQQQIPKGYFLSKASVRNLCSKKGKGLSITVFIFGGMVKLSWGEA